MRGLRAVSIAALVIAALAALPATPGAAKTPGKNGRIVYGAFDPATGHGNTLLYTANPDGSGRKLLLSADSCCASWSPDGRRLSVADAVGGRVTTAIVDADGSGVSVKTPADPTLSLACSAWSPDGSRMLCSGWDDAPSRPRGLFSIRVSDWGDLRQLTAIPNNGLIANDDPGDYSPDGGRIVFLRESFGSEQGRLFVANADGSGVTPITGIYGADCCGASWSPDGQWILYSAAGQLDVVHPDGSHRHAIVLHARCPRRSGPVVLAGLRVFGLHCRRGRPQTRASITTSVAFEPSWSPDGKRFVFSLWVRTSQRVGKRAVFTAAADGSRLRPVTAWTAVSVNKLDFPASTDWGPQPAP